MENASKALLIAGGMLIAMLILVMIVSLIISIQNVEKSKDEKKLTEQIVQFNKEYEAYNKTKMFGTDVITVVNKAIDYNKKLDVDNEKYKINIILNLKSDFDSTEETVIQYGNGTESRNTKLNYDATLKEGTYQLFERENSMKMDNNVLTFFSQSSGNTKKINNKGNYIETILTYSAITNFKTAVFKCENFEYSEETGMVKSMTFSQI